MTRSMVLTISVVFGFIILAVVGVAVLLLFPYDEVFGPTPTLTATSTVTPTATYPVYLPTAASETATLGLPTPANTRLPTITPKPTNTASPTVFWPSPTPISRTATAIAVTETPIITGTTTPTLTPVPPQRFFTLSFDAEKTTIDRGECVDLSWQSTGAVTLQLDNQPVGSSGSTSVCPRSDTSYTLHYQVAGSSQVKNEIITIVVNP